MAPKQDHLAPHEYCCSPQTGSWRCAIGVGAMPCPSCNVKEVHVIQALSVCTTATKDNQPASQAVFYQEQHQCSSVKAKLHIFKPRH